MSLRTRAILLVSLFMLTTTLALGTVLARQARNATKTQINARILDIVKTAAAMLDGDVLENLTAEDKGTPEYQQVLDILTGSWTILSCLTSIMSGTWEMEHLRSALIRIRSSRERLDPLSYIPTR